MLLEDFEVLSKRFIADFIDKRVKCLAELKN
jgi:hypothetical protein